MICTSCRQMGRHLGRRIAVASPSLSVSASRTQARHYTHVAPLASRTGVRATALPLPVPAAARRTYSAAGAKTAETAETAAAQADAETDIPPIPKPDFLDEAESHIWDLLCEAFAPAELSVRDISGGCGSMYGIEISSARFRGATMLKQQRMVNAALGDLVKGWHGVQLKTRPA